MHIDALLLPLSNRYVVTYATPIPNACDSSSTRDTPMLTHTTPSQRIVLHATHYELRRDLVEGNPFHLGEDSLLFSITLGALPSLKYTLRSTLLYVNIYDTVVSMSLAPTNLHSGGHVGNQFWIKPRVGTKN
jgi:hypothetical protein